jgi:hypothetical protein
MRSLLLFLPLVAAMACDSGTASKTFRRDFTFQDQGELCVVPRGTEVENVFLPPPAVAFEANGAATITVRAPTCLSSSCSKNAKAQCSVVIDGNVIHVTSTASYYNEGETCTDDCGALVSRCETPPLAAGIYFLDHGSDHVVLMVPSSGPAPCTKQAP